MAWYATLPVTYSCKQLFGRRMFVGNANQAQQHLHQLNANTPTFTIKVFNNVIHVEKKSDLIDTISTKNVNLHLIAENIHIIIQLNSNHLTSQSLDSIVECIILHLLIIAHTHSVTDVLNILKIKLDTIREKYMLYSAKRDIFTNFSNALCMVEPFANHFFDIKAH